MLIPYTFKICHRPHTVSLQVSTHKERSTVGHFWPQASHIDIWVARNGRYRTDRQISETFWHEVTHAILHDMDHPLWKDEKFVTAFSKRLNEVVHTARFK
jgi:hypothetical protein